MKFNGKIFIITVIIGFLLIYRFFKLGSIPMALYWDELAIGFDAFAISQTGKDIHNQPWYQPIYLSYGDYKAPVAIWLVSLATTAFGLHEWTVRLPFTIISILGATAAFLLLKAIIHNIAPKLNPIIPLIGFLILATSPWHFHFSRIGFESGLSLNLLLITILLFWYGLFKKSAWFIPALLTASLTIYAYISARYIVPLFLLPLLLTNLKVAWQKKWWILGFTIGLVLLQLPIYQSPYYHQSQQYRFSAQNILTDGVAYQQSAQLIAEHGNSIFARLFYHRYLFLAKAFLTNYFKHYTLDFYFLTGDINLRHHTGWGGELLLVTAPLLGLGIYWLFKHLTKPITWMITFWLLIAPLTAAIPYEVPHASRSIYLLIPLVIIMTIGVVQLFEQFKSYRNIQHYLAYAIIAVLIINTAIFWEDYFNHYQRRSAQAWQLGNTYIGQIVAAQKSAYTKILIPGDFWMPVNAMLFYNSDLVLEVQRQNAQSPSETLWWRNNNIGNLYQQSTNIDQNSLIISTQADPNLGQIQETYLYPDGTPMLYTFKPLQPQP